MKVSTLNDSEEIRRIDKSNMISFCIDASKHYGKAERLGRSISADFREPQTIIVAGMGGSAIGGELLKDWTRDRIKVPIEICREYSLPKFADKRSLVFVVSYSGETEESLSALLDAVRRGCMIACVSSGGTLYELAKKLSLPHVLVPAGMAPRATLPYLFMPLPTILEKTGLTAGFKTEVSETVKVLTQVSKENSPEKPLEGNPSKTIALSVNRTLPCIYGHGYYRAVAQRFKTQLNENSKIPAKWESFPELNHNEIVGWEELKGLSDRFSIIMIRDINEPPEIKLRIQATKELLSKESLKIHEVWGRGKSRLAKMCSVICLGDFASVYLAVLRGIDPTPVKTISVLKDRLARSGVKAKVIRELEKAAGN